MEPKRDITGREDIVHLVDAFYGRARRDKEIGHFFNEVATIDWDTHMPRMYDFWESTLFHHPTYSGNPIPLHIDLDRKSSMSHDHFERWVSLFTDTVNQLFDGPIAELARQRARSIATVMEIKIFQSR
ncbi:MAG: group III truncated hemoglobin [Flavobacteriales bacterium]|nr:group III truncated hemoglobin [Flavobacteriales bacterium]